MRKNGRRSGETVAAALVVCLSALFGCGRKAEPMPAELVRPRPIANLTAHVLAEGVRLEWTRPDKYVGGRRLDDLGGFLVFRGQPGEESAQVGEVAVADRERFQPEKKYAYVDKAAARGAVYYYRVVSFTTDHYYSPPSNQVNVRVEGDEANAPAEGATGEP
jgi:hypothetical protein